MCALVGWFCTELKQQRGSSIPNLWKEMHQFSSTWWHLCLWVRETEEDAGGADEGWVGGAEGETETDSESTRSRERGRCISETAGGFGAAPENCNSGNLLAWS